MDPFRILSIEKLSAELARGVQNGVAQNPILVHGKRAILGSPLVPIGELIGALERGLEIEADATGSSWCDTTSWQAHGDVEVLDNPRVLDEQVEARLPLANELHRLGAVFETHALARSTLSVLYAKTSRDREAETQLRTALIDFERARLGRGLAALLADSIIENVEPDPLDLARLVFVRGARTASRNGDLDSLVEYLRGSIRNIEKAALALPPGAGDWPTEASILPQSETSLAAQFRHLLDAEARAPHVSPESRVRCLFVLDELLGNGSLLASPTKERVRLPILFASTRSGAAAQLLVEEIADPFAKHVAGPASPLLVSDPARLGVRSLDRGFRGAIETAWDYVRDTGRAFSRRPGTIVRWWLEEYDERTVLAGSSCGASFAAAFLFVDRGELPDPRIAVTARIDAGGRLIGIGGLREKLRAIAPKADEVIVAKDQSAEGHPRGLDGVGQDAGVKLLSLPDVHALYERLRAPFGDFVALLDALGERGGTLTPHVFFAPGDDGNTLRRFVRRRELISLDPAREGDETGSERGGIYGRNEDDVETIIQTNDDPTSMRDAEGKSPFAPGRRSTLETWWQDGARHGLPHAIVKSPPGGGKTTLLWDFVARRMVDLRRELDSGRVSLRSADARIPLGLPLGSLTAARRGAFSLGEMLLLYLLDLAFGVRSTSEEREILAVIQAIREVQDSELENDETRQRLADLETRLRGLYMLDRGTASTSGSGNPRGLTWQLVRELERKVARHQVDLFLDALDELPEDGFSWLSQRLALFVKSGARLVITTRYPGTSWTRLAPLRTSPSNFASEHEPAARPVALLALRPFLLEDIVEFVSEYFDLARYRRKTPADFLRGMLRHPGPRGLSRAPLLLALLCDAEIHAGRNAPSARTRSETVEQGLARLLERARDKRIRTVVSHPELTAIDATHWSKRNAAKLSAVRDVAARAFDDGPKPITEGDVLRAIEAGRAIFENTHALPGTQAALATRKLRAECAFDPLWVFAELENDGLLVRVGNDFRLTLLTFHEYFFAESVAQRLAVLDPDQFRRAIRRLGELVEGSAHLDEDPLTLVDWKNVWPFVAERLDREQQAMLIEALLDAAGVREESDDLEGENGDDRNEARPSE